MKALRLLIVMALLSVTSFGQEANEGALVMRIAQALSTGDAAGYAQLFPSAGLIAQTVLQTAPPGSRDAQMMQAWQENPPAMDAYNSALDTALMRSFDSVRQEGTAWSVRWQAIQFSRYELVKSPRTRDSMYEKLAPERFLGYVFVRDPFLQKTFCFTVGDVLQIGGKWYGGTLTHIFPAETKDAFDQHLEAYRKAVKQGKDYIPVQVPKEDENDDGERKAVVPAAAGGNRKLVVERRFYRGKFDNEISVQLYVRGLRGTCPEGICSWEATFKFGDQDEWTPMSVTRSAGGKWTFTEIPPDGVLEVELKGGAYTGTWNASDDGTGYEAILKEEVPSATKLKALEAIMDGTSK